MDRKEIRKKAFKKFDDKVEALEANCTCEEYFYAGWDACEDVWIKGEPDKDKMISELESEVAKANSENYADRYVSGVIDNGIFLKALAKISTTIGSKEDSDYKLKKVRTIIDECMEERKNPKKR